MSLAVSLAIAGSVGTVHPAAAQPIVWADGYRDWLLRPIDLGGQPPDPAVHRPADLLESVIGPWSPDDPEAELFIGEFDPDGLFVRVDIVLVGLMNPPGRTLPSPFNPFLYGDHPVYGFVELDVDADVDTGGELETPPCRYVGNAARFGGLPAAPELEDRFALDASAFDGDFETRPFVERSGEEFHLALLGGNYPPGQIKRLVGNGDLKFERGETWQIETAWFHRAHGYEPFSLAQGGSGPGVYEPESAVQFAHDDALDRTIISVVFPRVNAGAAAMWGEPAEPPNGDPSDQFSVHEALVDLHDSAVFLASYPTGLPEEDIIKEWKQKDPEDFLDPATWRVNVLLGTSYTDPYPGGRCFVWTDVFPDALRGDVNGDGEAAHKDRDKIKRFIGEHDGDDGKLDGRVELKDVPVNFSVYDVNGDGVVEELDELLVSVPGDIDADQDVDLDDFVVLQQEATGSGVPCGSVPCRLLDLDTDDDVDFEDAARHLLQWTGPGFPEWPG